MEAQVTPNTFCTYTGHPSETDTTVFFVSGNPGLISYYHPFLSLLAQNLADHHKDPAPVSGKPASCQIYGNSLGGFEIEKGDQLSPSSAPHSHGDEKQKPEFYDLEDQIHFVHRNLHDLMAANAAPDSKSVSPRRKKVILIGHSVGAYITMEILRRHREATSSTSTKDTSKDQLSDVSTEFDVVGGVLLFPTVMDIASSPSGRKLTTLLSLIPRLALVVGFFARLLTFFLPARALRGLIRTVMNHPPDHALDTTFDFLTSSKGVTQALHMAADEMQTITTDKWTDDVWGVGTEEDSVAKLFFYFGRNDHWIAEKTREEIIALRGREDGLGPRMLVCEEGLPHAFCLKHNDTMARKVAGMIREIQG